MVENFVIVDTKYNSFYRGETSYIPWIVHGFTDNLLYARFYASKEEAKSDLDKFMAIKTQFDGNTPIPQGRLVVMQMKFITVE